MARYDNVEKIFSNGITTVGTSYLPKHEDKNSDIDLIKEYYGYSKEKAFQVLPLLSKDQLTFISKKLSKGGRKP